MEKKEEIILLPKIFDPRGSLTVTEEMKNIPFHIHRVEYLYGISQGKVLEKYTEKEGYKFYVALSGSFRITIHEDDETKRDYMLNRPYQGLLIQGDTHYSIHDFSNGVVCLEIE